MEQFPALRMFIAVADAKSFSGAAEALDVSISVVSRQIAALEAELGVGLLKRTTRTVELTEAGASYLARIRNLLAELENANKSLKAPAAGAAGPLRVAASSVVGLPLVAPAIAEFTAGQPQISFQFDILDRAVDPQEEGYDLAIALGEQAVEGGGKSLAQIEVGLFAAPAYLATFGRPRGPADLSAHRGLFLTSQPDWKLRGSEHFQPRPHFRSNRLDVLKTMCVAGHGIALLPHFLARTELERNDVTQLLDGFEPKPLNLVAVHSPTRTPTAQAQMFLKFLDTRFRRLRL
jgi:DNA-binding transcriptional LysR family regulator